MISSDAEVMAEVAPGSFVFGHFSPAFAAMQRELIPQLTVSNLSVGQSATVASLLRAMGGAGYVLQRSAAAMLETGRFRLVSDAPLLRQPTFAAMHLRHRLNPLHRKLLRIVQRRLASKLS